MNIYGMREYNTIIGQKCDTCGRDNLGSDFIPIRLEFSYGSGLDGETYDFCSNECAIKFLTDELNKGKKNETNS